MNSNDEQSTLKSRWTNPVSKNDEKIYSPLIGKWVKSFVTGTTHIGILAEVNSREGYIVFNPTLFYSEGTTFVRAEISPLPLRVPYVAVMGMQEVSETYPQEIILDAQRKNSLVYLESKLRFTNAEKAMNGLNQTAVFEGLAAHLELKEQKDLEEK